jgi:aryl-alcohol dehydrogenase-like predicted oxidoreductase
MTVPPLRSIGQTGLLLPPLGFGAFKIGRNTGTKYATPYPLPTIDDVRTLLTGVLACGCRYLDTAPAYGLSEERIGAVLGTHHPDVVLSTKVGETFADGVSTFDFSRTGVERSLERSRERLQRAVLDIVLIHSNGDDTTILTETAVVSVLKTWRESGRIRAIGLSGKTPPGAAAALDWADVVMVEYHQRDESHAVVMDQAAQQGVAVLVKKGLASGVLSPTEGVRFVLAHPAVTSVVVGGLNLSHFQTNWTTALSTRSPQAHTS